MVSEKINGVNKYKFKNCILSYLLFIKFLILFFTNNWFYFLKYILHFKEVKFSPFFIFLSWTYMCGKEYDRVRSINGKVSVRFTMNILKDFILIFKFDPVFICETLLTQSL